MNIEIFDRDLTLLDKLEYSFPRAALFARWYIRGLALGAVVFSMTACATTHIKSVVVTDPESGEVFKLDGYTSAKDVEIVTPSGWKLKANASTPTKIMLDGVGVIAGQVASEIAEQYAPPKAQPAPMPARGSNDTDWSTIGAGP